MTGSGAPDRVTWLVVLMTALLFVNYVDRGNLATVGPLLIDQQGLSNAQLGLLLSAFYFSYAPAQLLAGWLCERTDVYRLLAFGVALWSLTTAATGLVAGFTSLLLMRLLLGLGECVVFPGSSRLFAQLVPEERRGAANGWMSVGLAIGPAIGTFAGSLLAGRFGWQASFLVFGLLSFSWLWPWARFIRAVPQAARTSPARPPSYREMLGRRAAWGAFLGHFSSNYSFYFLISWLPTYLVKVRGLSISQMGVVGGLLFYTVVAASCVASGWYSDRMIRRGASVNSVRKGFIVYGQLGVGLCLILCACVPVLALPSLLVSAVFIGIESGPVYNIAQTLAGPRCAGQWVGVQNFFGNLAGIVAPYATGLMVDRSGHYAWAFMVAGAITFAGAAAWGWLIPKVEPLAWRDELRPGAGSA
ncbi:MAG TPA: MFS transporter [Steroidobacteraceae bacterium]|jgi:MFS family permease